MLKIDVAHSSVWEIESDSCVFFVKEGFSLDGDLAHLSKTVYPDLEKLFKSTFFTGKIDSKYVLSTDVDGKIKHLIFVGVGKLENELHENEELFRRAIGCAVKDIKRLKVKRVAASCDSIQSALATDGMYRFVRMLTCSFHIAGYAFDVFKSVIKDKTFSCTVTLACPNIKADDITGAVVEGTVIGESSNFTRNLADMPPNIATPTYIAEQVQQLSEKFGFACKIFGRDKAAELGMGGFLAVDSGSGKDGKFIEMMYSCGSNDAPTIALVGKGVTYDSGGINVKPYQYMKGMKYDMSGAAAVFGAMRAISILKPKVNVVGLTPLVENMSGSNASRLDDVITHLNGVTTEIEHTDAEGRLILADALSYAEKFHTPDVIIDLATLTGACVVALGHFFTGLMTTDKALEAELVRVGKQSGDWLWPLPLHDFYQPAVKSDIADITNSGNTSYGAGTIKAACFLSNFVSKTPWAHLDIAGTESGIPDAPQYGKGASGVGVRVLVDFVQGFKAFDRKKNA